MASRGTPNRPASLCLSRAERAMSQGLSPVHGSNGQGERGNGFFASAASTCEVTHTGVVTYFAE